MQYVFFLFLIAGGLDCFAQIDIVNRTVTRRDSNFAFEKERNLFAITGPKNVKWQLRSIHAKIEPTDSAWLFDVEPSRLGADTFFLIRNGIVVLTKTFEVIPEPPFILRWGVLKTDTATAPEVIANRRMIMSIPGRSDCPSCNIFSFVISLISDQAPAHNKMIKVQGNVLTPEVANIISKLTHGDKIVFSNIILVAFDARLREMPGFTIVIR
jgi:hypothetical protein